MRYPEAQPVTTVKLTPAEIRLLKIQRAQGIPYPDDIFAWRKANAGALTALQAHAVAQPAAGPQAEAGQ
jgi:hypothetical protein